MVVIWNMDTLQTVSSSQEHSHIITDVCFRPNSSQLATSSFDKTVRIWNAAEVWFFNTFTYIVVVLTVKPEVDSVEELVALGGGASGGLGGRGGLGGGGELGRIGGIGGGPEGTLAVHPRAAGAGGGIGGGTLGFGGRFGGGSGGGGGGGGLGGDAEDGF
ncbi:hypothetical protein B296_00002468 [Ensete ventricosum]|uniref:Uncharacterized protein n=1 Tax=Ensete ventricosum TaxID=4639 RepID=A0A427B9E6_ENSVE|nr:hypothetical protein B296_00002468 [Ensete ventricosum]